MLNIKSQWQDREILIFRYKSILRKIGHILKLLVLKFHSDLSVRSRDIAEKQVPAKLKPIVDASNANIEKFQELKPISPPEPRF